MHATGDSHIRPVQAVADIDPMWERDVMTAYGLIRFHIDSGQLPPGMMGSNRTENDEG